MLLFFGLGNNEAKYLSTKHNIGRLVLEKIVDKLNGKFELSAKVSFYKHVFENDEITYFVHSNGYMNTSGEALASFLKYYKIDTTAPDFKLIILHDDSDQLEQNFKFLPGGGSAGHNGIIDIYKHLPGLSIDINQIWRLKIGIRPPNNKLKSETFVLNRSGENELEFANQLGSKVFDKINLLVDGNFDKFQSHLKM